MEIAVRELLMYNSPQLINTNGRLFPSIPDTKYNKRARGCIGIHSLLNARNVQKIIAAMLSRAAVMVNGGTVSTPTFINKNETLQISASNSKSA
jgi:hypothetical protein